MDYVVISSRFRCSVCLSYFMRQAHIRNLQLAAGTDLYTISKMLTHSNVGTTQVYADVVSDLKRKASEQITLKQQ